MGDLSLVDDGQRQSLHALALHQLLCTGIDFRNIELGRFYTTEQILSSLLLYRGIFYLLPLAAGLLVLFLVARACLRISRGDDSDDRLGAAVAAASLAAWGVSSATGFSVTATGSLAAVLAGWVAGRSRRGDARSSDRTDPCGAGS